jgi:hypothetical protein
MRRISPVLLLMLAACQQGAGPGAPAPDNAVPVASGLERAAIETGVIADVSQVSPVGLYQRRQEAGQDSLCVMPGKAGAFRFGAEAVFGADEVCRGRGTARRAGDKLILSFSGGSRCIVVAQYDGDRIALPGVVDMACADLCSGRGSLEGVTFPRVAAEASAALRAKDRDGDALCEAD